MTEEVEVLMYKRYLIRGIALLALWQATMYWALWGGRGAQVLLVGALGGDVGIDWHAIVFFAVYSAGRLALVVGVIQIVMGLIRFAQTRPAQASSMP